jgi:hypothetical protein
MFAHNHSDRQPPGGQETKPLSTPDLGSGHPGFWRSKTAFVAIGFSVIAAFLLLSEHRAHALGYLPFLLLLACPLLHMFMHKGHGGHGKRGSDGDAQRAEKPTPPSKGA